MSELKAGQLYWSAINPRPFSAPRLERDLDCDVLIIGSGITGAFVAHQLAAQGLQTVVVDRRAIGQGSTPASTALVQYEIDITLRELSHKRGPTQARAAYTACHAAVDGIETLCHQLGLGNRTRRPGSLYLATSISDEPLLREEAAARSACGIECEFLTRWALRGRYGINRPCALFSPQALEVDPVALTNALHESSRAAGVQFFQDTDVQVTSAEKDHVSLHAAHGPELRARHVIFASGYETPSILGDGICEYRSTFALATEPIPAAQFWPGRCMFWEHADPYFYARSTPDGRIVMGGEDIPEHDPAVRDALIGKKTATLMEKLHRLLPSINTTPAFIWAGTFAVTDDGLAIIGPAAHLPGCQFALGYGGNGITFGYVAAGIICDNVLGRPNPLQRLFSLDRLGRRVNVSPHRGFADAGLRKRPDVSDPVLGCIPSVVHT